MATPGTDHKSFFRSLYDLHFTSFITSRLLKVLYALLIVLYSLAAVLYFLLLVVKGGTLGVIVAVFFVPLLYLISLIGARLSSEFLMVVFRIGDDVRELAQRKEASGQ